MFRQSLFFLFLVNISFAQNSDISDFKSLHKIHDQKATIPGEGFAGFLFSAYKTYVSSQDKNTCVYSPSCSEYALRASQKKGLPVALPQIFDRLLRCNLVHAARYPVDAKTGLALDEP
jgi:putative component of membrane protein insertase Oxa1/YidC/SpoIIIJ protein YidD